MKIVARRFQTLFLLILLGLPVAAGHCEPATSRGSVVFVSNATSGTITRYHLDDGNADLTFMGRTVVGNNVMPLAVSPDKQHLYAAIRAEPYQIVTYAITYPSGELTRVANAPLPASMASLDTDKSGRYLLAASYGESLLSVSPVNPNGAVTNAAQQSISTGQNAHTVHTSANNRFAISTALGDDQLAIFRFDEKTGTLSPNKIPTIAAPRFSGPRHFVFAPQQPFVYVLGELSGTVSTYRFNETQGSLTLIDTVEGMPASKLGLINRLDNEKTDAGDGRLPVWAADIHISPNGKYLYLSERTKSVIATLKIDENTGLPSFVDLTDVEMQPRGFALSDDGRFMVVAGEKAASVGLYQINQRTGDVTKVGKAPTDEGANWVEIITIDK